MTMKKLIYGTLLVFGFSFVSCDDELNQLPNNAFSPDTYYQTPTDFNSAARGMYSGMLSGAYYGGSFLSRPDIMSDNVILAQRGRRSNQFFFEWRYVANASWDLMTSAYIVTNRANRIITSINNLPDGPEKDAFLGEAKAVRAMALFDLVRLYSPATTQFAGAEDELGMNIVTSVDPNFQEIRPTVRQSMDFIIDELVEASTLVADNSSVDRFNRNSVFALLSRVYLYDGKYQECIDAADEVTVPIASIADFPGVWTDSNNSGVILKIDQDRNLDGTAIGTEWSQSAGGEIIPEYVFSFEFFNLFQSNDVRTNAYSFIGVDSNGDVYNAIRKMLGEAGQNNGIVDAKLLRAAEVYLNKAEAYYMLGGNETNALTALNELRSRRYTGFVSPNESGVALLNAIRLERRLELAFEGHRFFDLKRWGLGVSRSATEGDYFDGSGTPTTFTTLPAGNFRFQMAIPQAEINIFPAYQQNPDY